MPTCSKGQITKTANGTVTLMGFGTTLRTMEVKDRSAFEKWDNCKCKDGEKVVETKCITAQVPDKNDAINEVIDIGHGFKIKIDLKVDTTRDITNCEFECKPEAY